MTLKFNGFKAKRNFHTVKIRTFQKYEMYENKYRTKICDFTVDQVKLMFFPYFLFEWQRFCLREQLGYIAGILSQTSLRDVQRQRCWKRAET